MAEFGTRITHVALDANRVIANGDTIIVYGIHFNNATGANVEFEVTNGDITVSLMHVAVQDDTSFAFETPFVADDGLALVSVGDATATVTVVHSAVGA